MKHSVVQGTLPNDVQLTVIEVPDSSIIEARLFFNAGFEYFDQDTFHVPHLLEHLLVGNGREFAGEEQFLRATQELGAYVNATTDYQHVTIFLRAPTHNFAAALKMTLDGVFGLKLTKELLEKEKDIVLREIHEQYDGFGNRAVCSLLSLALEGLVPRNWEHYLDKTAAIEIPTIKAAYKKFKFSMRDMPRRI